MNIEEREDPILRAKHYRGEATSPHSGRKIGAMVSITQEMLDNVKPGVVEHFVGQSLKRAIEQELEIELDAMEAYRKSIAEYEGHEDEDWDCNCETHVRRRREAKP